MKYTKLFLFFILLTYFIQASNDRSIYRKTYGTENKVALVIGNSNYTNFSPLKNTLNDAKDMRDVLKTKGFDVLYLENGDLRSMEKILRKFAYKLKQGGVGLFYYAGHGLEIHGNNYLIPTKAEIPEQDEVKYASLAVNLVIDKMRNSHNRLNIIILDACRSNPFGRDGSGGLAHINSARGMYIAFATAPGEIASDGGSERNGLFTKYLISNIKQPNLTLNEVFKQTRASVDKESNSQQLPWTSSSVIGDFYFQIDDRDQEISTSAINLTSNLSMSDADKIELERYRLEKQKKIQVKKEAELTEFRRVAKLEEEKKAKKKADELAEFQAFKNEKAKREAKADKELLAKESREKEAKEEKNRYSLTVNPTPSDAKVQITNIKPRYKDGIKLKKGTYKIKVSKVGYQSERFTISLNENSSKEISLKKEIESKTSQRSNRRWISPSVSVCRKNGGEMWRGTCQAKLSNAEKICKASGGRLPTIDILKTEVKRCGGIPEKKQINLNKSSYHSCYKKNGFIGTVRYWSTTPYISPKANSSNMITSLEYLTSHDFVHGIKRMQTMYFDVGVTPNVDITTDASIRCVRNK